MAKTTFLITTLGCRVNQVESRQLAQDLVKQGYQPSDDQPDIVIINTCVITQKGENESAKTIRHYHRQYPQAFLIVTGCAANLWSKFKRANIPANLLVTNEDKAQLASLIKNRFPIKKAKSIPPTKKTFRETIKIQDGCDHFCSYCIVPFLRINQQSQSPEKVISQINDLVAKGKQEIIISGVNLALYGQKGSFNRLIKKILAETKVARLSLSSLTPLLIDDELVKIFIQDQKTDQRLASYWHLALQSASPRVLSNMNRSTNLDQLKNQIKKIKQSIADFNLRADILLGFPQESRADFNQTVDFVKQTGLSFAHTFTYSPRPGTLAETKLKTGLWSPVLPEEQKHRQKIIRQAVDKNRQILFDQMKDQQQSVLVLKETANGWWGLTRNYWPITITDPKKTTNQIGQIINVQVKAARGKSLTADFLLAH